MKPDRRSILLISPHYAPMPTGLGDYTTILHQELLAHTQASVLTSVSNLKAPGVHSVVRRWKFFELLRVFRQEKLYDQDQYFVQYVPFMYERRGGINFSFCLFLLYLARLRGKHVDLMVHEVNYPFELKPKSLLMFFSHGLMMGILLLASRKVFISTDYFQQQLKNIFRVPEKKLQRLSVGSNIPAARFRQRPWNQPLRLCMFGKLHPAKEVHWLLGECLELHRQGLLFELVYIGESQEELLKLFSSEEKLEFLKFLKPLGFLDDQAVALELSSCDILLAYFVDGLSSRRGSVMAALNNGLEVISTDGSFTEKEFRNKKFIHLLPIEKKKFRDGFAQFLQTWTPTQDSRKVHAFYEAHFSWKKVVETYLSFSTGTDREV